MSRKLCALFFILICAVCSAQSDSLQLITEETIEDLLEETDGESDNSDLFDLIEYYIIHPVNLNTAAAEELSSVPYLDIPVARLIISHREKYGNFFSVYELYSLTEIQESVIKKILPFVTVNKEALKDDPDKPQLKNFTLNLRSRILLDIQQRKGYREGIYFGSPYKFYNRLSLNYSDNIGAGFLTEKDPGEKRYYDFYSGYINISGWHNFESIIVGDYIVEFGQGLALWNQYGTSRSSDAVNSVKAKSRGIIPYRSASENRFFRGAAFSYKWEHVDISCFFSKNSLDASLDSISGSITSIPIDGFHRTYNEVNKRNKITETSYGATLNYTFNSNGYVGLMHYSFYFNLNLHTINSS